MQTQVSDRVAWAEKRLKSFDRATLDRYRRSLKTRGTARALPAGLGLGLGLGIGCGPSGSAAPATPLTLLPSVIVKVWLRADLGNTIATDGKLADQSGGGRDATQATAGSRCAVTASDSTLSNLTTLTYDGVDDFHDVAYVRAAPGTTATWMWFIFKQNAWTNNEMLLADTTANRFLVQQNSSTPNLRGFNAAATPLNATATIGSWFRGQLGVQNSTADYLKIGGTASTGVLLGNNAGTGLRIGASNTPAAFASFSLRELVVTAGIPTGGEISNLDTLYGVPQYGAGLF
jgi:hypothetical protein